MYGLLTMCEVNLDGKILIGLVLFFCVLLAQKKRGKLARSVVMKDLLYALKNTVFFRETAGNPLLTR